MTLLSAAKDGTDNSDSERTTSHAWGGVVSWFQVATLTKIAKGILLIICSSWKLILGENERRLVKTESRLPKARSLLPTLAQGSYPQR